MTFSEILPALESGKKCRVSPSGDMYRLRDQALECWYASRKGWVPTANDFGWFLSRTWEVVAEEDFAEPCPPHAACHDTVARLKRELNEVRAACASLGRPAATPEGGTL